MALELIGPQTGNRPGCWGRSDIYDRNSRDCRNCGYQSSCRDQVIRTVASTQPMVPQIPTQQNSYYQNWLPPQPQPQPQAFAPQPIPQLAPQPMPVPFQAPVPVVKFNPPPPAPMQQVPPPMFAQQMQQPQRPMMPAPVPNQSAPVMVDWYGRSMDPLHFALFQPPPFRPQLVGETFMERVIKNVLLDLGAMALFHLGLAVRQLVLPPQQPHEKIVNHK